MAGAIDLPWAQLHGDLKAFIGRRVANPADAEDLVQRVLLQILKGIGALRDSERLHAWVYQTARNAIVDHYRSAGARRETASGDAEDLAPMLGPDAVGDDDDATALRELAVCMGAMIDRLPPEYRQAIRWADLEGVAQAEAARRAGITLSGMKSRVQRGRRQLRDVLEQCCRVDLDRRGTIVAYEPRKPVSCSPCADCAEDADLPAKNR